MCPSDFDYLDIRFADIQMLRYKLLGFDELCLQQKIYIYYLSEATLYGRDITFDQFGKYNLKIRKVLEAIYTSPLIDKSTEQFGYLELYLKRVWFSNGIYHHYGCEKFKPNFSPEYLLSSMLVVDINQLPLVTGESVEDLFNILRPVIFDPDYQNKRVNKVDGEDLVRTSACNYYEGLDQQEVENYYGALKSSDNPRPASYGLNSKLIKDSNGVIREITWRKNGMYGKAIAKIIECLQNAIPYAENKEQKDVIETLIQYYQTGNLELFDIYSIKWIKAQCGDVDFINGFIEVYGDPLAIKASWEGIVEYKDLEATKRTRLISDNAQWFEDHSPIDVRFKKKEVVGVSANVVRAAMLGGDEYPSTAIGINLPNADWIRAEYGSKSVTISNIIDSYNKASQGNGFLEEFVNDELVIAHIKKYGDLCDCLHTDLHECLGHGSGKLLPGVDPDALKAYGNTIEEARADLFALYYLADEKLVELGLLPNNDAYKAEYYSYIMNGLMTQLVRIPVGGCIEEAHMRNRALISRWCLENGNAVRLTKKNGKSFVEIVDYNKLRALFASLLFEIQRIKSEGDYEAARAIVEEYAVNIDTSLHSEVISRYEKLGIAPYKGFINPRLLPVTDNDGNIQDIHVDYSETYDHQMLRYSRDYATLI